MEQKEMTTEHPPPGWRFRIGIIFFVLGLVCPVFIPLVSTTGLSTKWKAIISGLLAVGIPELLWMAAVAVLGKPGFNYIKGRFYGFFKKIAPPDTVSRIRYRIGLAIFVLPILFGWLGPYGAHLIPGYETHRFVVSLIGDVMFVASFFVLGGNFWDKVRALFIYEAKSHIPGQK